MARILVIDDEDGPRRVLSRALQEAGHEVLEASEGTAALQLHLASAAQLVITDLYMPRMDGMEILMALRKLTPGIKIIAISGGGQLSQPEDALETAQALGAYAAFAKPFHLRRLLETVEEALAA
ncbi:MAG TPA: response regulator [Candidatus Eisenbacteria bacterium]|nr:response regulator [Candidatus Eisenbacteria bacterium]